MMFSIPGKCSVDGCTKPRKSRGWCAAHYERHRQYGDPLRGGPIGTTAHDPQDYYDAVVRTYEGDDCLEWPFARSGVGYAQMRVDGTAKNVHRLICRDEHGEPPTPKHQAAHSCGRGHFGCVNRHHLRWATARENYADRRIHGTVLCGEKSNSAKLSTDDVLAIRNIRRGGTVIQVISEQFGVSASTISKILSGKLWRHI